MTKTGIPYLDLTWSPSGFGCSKGCRTCWARKTAARFGPKVCPDCRAFRPHFHPERLGEPSRRRKPAVIGVDFYADLFDPSRPITYIRNTILAANWDPQHEYVFLTERPNLAREAIDSFLCATRTSRLPFNWYMGATIRNQAQANETDCEWQGLPGNRWLSLEPLEGPVMADWNRIADSIIIGADNDPSVPWNDGWALDVVRNFSGPTYVKQIRLADGRLTDNPAFYPPELRRRELPWTLAKKEQP